MGDLGISFENQKYNKPLLSDKEGNNIIGEFLKSNHPFLASKVPNLVCYMADHFLLRNEPIPDHLKKQALVNMGIYPNDQKSLEKFVLDYIENLKDVNVMGVWAVRNYDWLINTYCPLAHYVKLHSLEPFNFHSNPWSAYLANKKVLVIHPFETSVINNYKNRDKLFIGTNILPEFELKTIKAEQNLSNIDSNYFDSIERTKNKILDIDDFDVAIVGCGASGLPLSAFIKRELNKTAIHMGGVTQILFGIMGRRWDLYDAKHFVAKNFINEYWSRPLPEETPENFNLVEGGCYW